MTWYAWVAVAFFVVGTLATVSMVGKPREPLDGGTAALVVLANGLLIWLIVALAERAS